MNRLKGLSFKDKFIILTLTFVKALRGLLKLPFMKKSKGILFLGKKVDMTHIHMITIGKNVIK